MGTIKLLLICATIIIVGTLTKPDYKLAQASASLYTSDIASELNNDEATTTDARDESSQEVHPYIAPQDSTEADRINTWLVQLDSIQNAEDPVIYFEVIEVKKGNTLDKLPFLLSPYEAALFADREDLPKSYDSTGMLNVTLTIDDQYVKATRKSGKYFFYRNTPDKYCLAEN